MQQVSKGLYQRLLRHVRPYWKTFGVSIIATVIVGLSEPAIPAIIGPLLDGSFVENDADTAFTYSLMLLGLFIVRGLAQYVSTIAMGWVGYKVVMDLREAMFNKLIVAPNAFLDQSSSGNLLSKFSYDVTQVHEATTGALVIVIRDTVTVIGLLAFMLYTDWQLALLFFVIVPLIAVVLKVIAKRLRRVNLTLQNQLGDMNSIVEEGILGHNEVKLFGGQTYERDRFHTIANWVRQNFMKSMVTSAASVPVVQFMAITALAVIVNLASSQEPPMSVGTFVAFFGAMGLLLSPIKRLTSVNDPLQRGMAAAQSVFGVMDEPAETDEGTRRLEAAHGKVEFRHVNFRYPQAKSDALTDISLTITPGETIALVGQSGSGKSTLASLLPRFYPVTSGLILVDDIDIEEIKLADLRNNLSLVSQQVVLFNDTIAANIAYGATRGASEEEVIQAAEKAHAMEFIKDMPEGLQTLTGQNGVRLSGGQRQRIAIARALLKNAPILILDEATSALDTESEQKVQQALDELMQGRTTITIAHRLSTIKKADRIVVLDQGRIVEIGSHDELLQKSGRYAELYQIQFSGQEGK